ncbi:MAG: cyclic 2,3-diphosphoglycerate synthase [Actinomycetota bacterium]|nr:cyclic 2,3-diphosphoglycerate synthase [Actinomycetota bacterium]
MVIDGEHYPPVTKSALDELTKRGDEVVGAVLVGGKEKLSKAGLDKLGDLVVHSGDSAASALDEAIADLQPERIFDLSDEPVLDYRKRHLLASVALYRNVAYEGADFLFTPPPFPDVARTPVVATIGTGKRTGKTAITGFWARLLKEDGRSPVIVAMGRGGPPEPEVLRGDEIELLPRDLLELADSGKHAASDYVEDALLGRVPTVGCRRCGGGLAGAVAVSNVREGVEIANGLGGDFMLLEGSGSAIPPVRADSTVLVTPANVPLEYLAGYMGPYRLLLSDVVLITMCEEPFGSPSHISDISSEVRGSFRGSDPGNEIQVVRTVFRPSPTRSVEGANVFVATTAPEAAGGSIKRHLERDHGCRVVGISHSLSDREKLEEEIKDIKDSADVLLAEIKAAAIDVATRHALDHGLDVVYMDNVPHGVDGDDPAEALRWAAALADERSKAS